MTFIVCLKVISCVIMGNVITVAGAVILFKYFPRSRIMSVAATSLANLLASVTSLEAVSPTIIAEAAKPDGVDPTAVDAATARVQAVVTAQTAAVTPAA